MRRVEDPETAEQINESVRLAQQRYQRVLSTNGISERQRQEAQAGLRQVDQFLSGQGGAPVELRGGFFKEALFGGLAFVNQAGALIQSGLKEAIADPLRGESSSFGEFVQGASGIDQTGKGLFENLTTLLQTPLPIVLTGDGLQHRDLALQTSFGDVTGDWGGDNAWLNALEFGLNFTFDVALDPTTYMGGVGVLKGAAVKGAAAGGRRAATGALRNSARNMALDSRRVFTEGGEILTRNVTRESMALTLIDEAFLGTVPRSHRKALEEFATRTAEQGAYTARRSLDDVQRGYVEQYVRFGTNIRAPWYLRRPLGDRVFLIPGTDNAAQNLVRLGMERAGTRAWKSMDGYRFARDARRGIDAEEAAAKRAIGGTKGRDLRKAARKGPEVFKRHVTTGDIIAVAAQAGRSFKRELDAEVIAANPSLTFRNGRLDRAGKRALEQASSPEVRASIQGALNDPSIDIPEEAAFFFDSLEKIGAKVEAAKGVPVNLEVFRRRFSDMDKIEEALQSFKNRPKADQDVLLEGLNPEAGMMVGAVDGVPVFLTGSTVEDMRAAFTQMTAEGAEVSFGMGDDAMSFLDSFATSMADRTTQGLMAKLGGEAGITPHPASIKPINVTKLLASTSQMAEFQNPEIRDILAKILPSESLAKRAREFEEAPSVKGVRALEEKIETLRRPDHGTPLSKLEDRARHLNTGGTPSAPERAARRRAVKAARRIERHATRVASLRQRLDELDVVAEIAEDEGGEVGGGIASEVTRLRAAYNKELEENTWMLGKVEEQFDALFSGENGAKILGKSYDDIDELRRLSRDIGELRAISPLHGNKAHDAFLSQVSAEIFGTQTKLTHPKTGEVYNLAKFKDRKALIEGESIRADVVDAMNGGRMGEMVQAFEEATKDVLTRNEMKKIRPMVELMQDLVRFDNISLSTVLSDPKTFSRKFSERAGDVGGETGEIFQGAAAAADFAGDLGAEVARIEEGIRQALREDSAYEAPAELMDELGSLKVQKHMASVHASELATIGELQEIGADFGGEKLLSFAENMSESQYQAIANNMSIEGDKLIPADGVFKVAGIETPFDDVAEMLAYKAEFMEDPSQWRQVARQVNSMFRNQATLSPGFSFRNNYSAAHMNAVAGGLRWSDYRKAIPALEAARSSLIDPSRADEFLGKLSPDDRRAVEGIMANTDVVGGFRSLGSLATAQTRTGDALQGTSGNTTRYQEFITKLFPGTVGAGDKTRELIETAALFNERTVARSTGGLAMLNTGNRRARREALAKGASDYTTEELHRFALMHKLVTKDGVSPGIARRQMEKIHFDYADKTLRDTNARDYGFPFWTFMSRNLPLQMEMLAKRPGAFNNLVAFQEFNNKREGESLNPTYFDERLHYVIPEEVWIFGGDQIVPDLQFNDIIRRTSELDQVVDPGVAALGIDNIGGIDPKAGLNVILGDASPIARTFLEIQSGRDTFTGRRLDRFEAPITNTALDSYADGRLNPVTQVVGALFTGLGWSRHVPVNPYEPDGEKRWEFSGQANQTLANFLPLLNRVSRLAPAEDSRARARWEASWINFIAGGVRLRGDTDYLIRAYEFDDDSSALISELSALAVPDGRSTSQRGRRRRI